MQEFCGKDDNRHFYSCENWYLYGGKQYTTYKDQKQPELVCSDLEVGDSNAFNYLGKSGVHYGCSISSGLRQPFTQKMLCSTWWLYKFYVPWNEFR